MNYFQNNNELVALSDDDVRAFDNGTSPDPRTTAWVPLTFDQYTALAHPPLTLRQVAQASIVELEVTITARRLREAILGDDGWLAGVDAQIAALRAQL